MLRASIASRLLSGLAILAAAVAFHQSTFDSRACSAEPPGRPVSTEPRWTYGIVRTGEDRDAIKSLPMTERPYRPLHFYGNTVRRMYYRGTPLPAPRDVVGASAATILRK